MITFKTIVENNKKPIAGKYKNDVISKRSESKAMDAIVNIINTNCKEWLSSPFSTPIYRGMPKGPSAFVAHPSQVTRVSQHTGNIYTLVMDNAPEWKDYPKRSHSAICSTSTLKTNAYGDTYEVIPFDGARIGVCPKDDIWHSFRKSKYWQYEANLLVNGITYLVRNVLKTKLDDTSWEGLQQSLAILDKTNPIWPFLEIAHKEVKQNSYGDIEAVPAKAKTLINRIIADDKYNAISVVLTAYHDSPFTTMLQFLSSALDPVANGFELTSVGGDLESPGDWEEGQEVWTDSDILMVKFDLMQKVRERIFT